MSKYSGDTARFNRIRKQRIRKRATDKIREAAYAIKADLIVMGAYGHSRLREWMLGGATRELLSVCDTALLMMH